jgi:uncharacterized protein DUF5648/parallel beta helix pectate lyase-like protein/prealbumin domain-containing protein
MSKAYSKYIAGLAMLALVVGSVGAFAPQAQAVEDPGPWYANVATGNDDNDCLSATNDSEGVGPCKTIQAAVGKASEGGTVIVAAGVYEEHVILDKAITLEGANSSVDCPEVRSAESVITGDSVGAVQIMTDNVIINGFQISSGDNDLGSGIWTPDGGTVSGFDVRNNLISQSQIGMAANSDGPSTIFCNVFDGNNEPGSAGGTGIYSANSSGLAISNNEFRNHLENHPINFAANAPYVNAHTSLAISGNIFSGTNAFGVRLLGVNGGSFSGNDVDTNDATGLVIDAGNTDLTVTGNTFHDGWQGVRVQDYINNGLVDPTPDPAVPAASDIHINNNSITGNIDSGDFPGFGVNNASGYDGSLDATCNWWGAADGPGPVGPGSGDKVSTGVTFSPWLTSSDLEQECEGGPATLTIVKHLDGEPTPEVGDIFNITVDGTGDSEFFQPVLLNTSTMDGDNNITSEPIELSPGNYDVNEISLGAGWHLADVQCVYEGESVGISIAGGENITVDNGDDVTCTFTNTRRGTLIVKKTVVNDNNGDNTAGDFSFQVSGGETTSDAMVFNQQEDPLQGKNHVTVDPNTPQTVTEPEVNGYTTTYDNCTDVVIAALGEATCTITNNDVSSGGGHHGGSSGGGTTPPGQVLGATTASCLDSTVMGNLAAVYRFWNASAGDHFYTANASEKPAGYVAEGLIGYVMSSQTTGSVPLYRYWNGTIGDHFYTTSIIGDGNYTPEGILGYVFPSEVSGSTPLYRLYKVNDDHFYTYSATERDAATLLGYGVETTEAYVCGNPVPGSETTPLYRSYNSGLGDHFYTTNPGERDAALASGYHDEGIAGYLYGVTRSGVAPIYRLWSSQNKDHFYTTSAGERDAASGAGNYQYEDIIGYIDEGPAAGNSAFYRLNKPNDDHFYTSSTAERDAALGHGYVSEGIMGYIR